MEREKIEVKEEILLKKIEWINKMLTGKEERFLLKGRDTEEETYTIYIQNKFTNNIVSARMLIDSYDVLQYLCGIEKGIQLFA